MPKATTTLAHLSGDEFKRIQVEMYDKGKLDSMTSLKEALQCIPVSTFNKQTIMVFMDSILEALTGNLH